MNLSFVLTKFTLLSWRNLETRKIISVFIFWLKVWKKSYCFGKLSFPIFAWLLVDSLTLVTLRSSMYSPAGKLSVLLIQLKRIGLVLWYYYCYPKKNLISLNGGVILKTYSVVSYSLPPPPTVRSLRIILLPQWNDLN